MGIEITGGSSEFSGNGHFLQEFQLAAQTVGKYFEFLAQTGGRSRLTVCFGQHRYFFPLFGQFFQFGNQFVDGRIIDIVDRIPERTGYCRIVDILGSQTEMDKFFIVMKVQGIEFFFDKIFDCFDIVVGYFFNVLDFLCIFYGKVPVYLAQLFEHPRIETCQLRKGYFT